LPLGISDEADYVTNIAEIAPGEAVFIATDGVTDAFDSKVIYGANRLSDVLSSTQGEAADLGSTVLADVKTFIGGRPLADDVTVVCFSRNSVQIEQG
jgi:sigma-B regulation protein RsbU (phosphoserine phosphatase)